MTKIKTLIAITAAVMLLLGQKIAAQEILHKNTTADTSATYLIKLTDKTVLSGKILEKTNDEIIFYDLTIGKVTISMKKIEKITRLSDNQYCQLTTNDGKTFTGLILSQNDKEITIETESLSNVTIANNKISSIKMFKKEQIVNGKYFFLNPHPTRYFFGPSAIPLEKGESYYQNAYILANSVQTGITDHFSIGGGIVIPFLFFVTPKVGFKVAEKVHIGAGILAATTVSSNIPFGIGVAYGSVTFGSKENNFTINAGWGAVKQENYNNQTNTYKRAWELSKKPMFTFSGMLRVAPKCSLISENWVFATNDYKNDLNGNFNYSYNYHAVISGGLRLMGEKNSFDLAIAMPMVEGGKIYGVPYIDYVYKF